MVLFNDYKNIILSVRANKKFILKTSAITIILVASFWILLKKPIQKDYVYEKKINNQEKRNELLNKDTDNDGLKDWEEILWKTDPNNPDTDGDKTTDGEEIKLNRNLIILRWFHK